MRLIDADALMDALNVFQDRKNGNEHFMYGIETAKELLGIQPTVDAVPVTRCAQCKYGSKCLMDMIQCKVYGVLHSADWFCAGGERKNG